MTGVVSGEEVELNLPGPHPLDVLSEPPGVAPKGPEAPIFDRFLLLFRCVSMPQPPGSGL